MSATWPNYAVIALGSNEKFSSVVLRTEMERGVPKQRRFASDSLVTVPVVVFFKNTTEASNFETWVYTQIGGGADFFSWTNPKTGLSIQARIVGGDIGTLSPTTGNWQSGHCQRSMTLEYLRSAY